MSIFVLKIFAFWKDLTTLLNICVVLERIVLAEKVFGNKLEILWHVSKFSKNIQVRQPTKRRILYSFHDCVFHLIDMKANNYEVVDAGETITFKGIVQRSTSQAFFLVFCTAIGMLSLALVLQIQFQDLGKYMYKLC